MPKAILSAFQYLLCSYLNKCFFWLLVEPNKLLKDVASGHVTIYFFSVFVNIVIQLISATISRFIDNESSCLL